MTHSLCVNRNTVNTSGHSRKPWWNKHHGNTRRSNTYMRSGLYLCMSAQKAIPFLNDVVMLVMATSLYPSHCVLHHCSRALMAAIVLLLPSPFTGQRRTGGEFLQWGRAGGTKDYKQRAGAQGLSLSSSSSSSDSRAAAAAASCFLFCLQPNELRPSSRRLRASHYSTLTED